MRAPNHALLLGSTALAGMALVAPSASAQTRTWTPTTIDWFTDGNWTPNGKPQTGDTAIVNAASDISGAATANLTELDLGSNAFVRVISAGTLNVSSGVGTIYLSKAIGDNSTLSVLANSTANANSLVVGFNGDATATFGTGTTGSFLQTNVAQNSGSIGHLSIGDATVNSGITSVGTSGNADLTINAAAVVTSSRVVIADLGGTSTAVVDGANTKWDISAGSLTVGERGQGSLTVSAGAATTSSDLMIGDSAGAIGNVLVTGGGSSLTTGTATIGENGSGTLRVAAGGVANIGDMFIADGTGSTGAVTVTGGGSHLTDGATFVGGAGVGTLTIQAGGLLTSTGDSIVAAQAGSNSTATITGANSEWDLGAHSLAVGGAAGSVGTVEVDQGGSVTAGSIGLATEDGATGTIKLENNASWSSSGGVSVGAGTGALATLDVFSGSDLTTTQAISAGISAGSTGNIAVDGTNSHLSSDALYIGQAGTGSLHITSGGVVDVTTPGTATIGSSATGVGSVLVSGAGSEFNPSSYLTVGDSGAGTIDVASGAAMSSANTDLGALAGGAGTITVRDAGSTWTEAASLRVGDSGTGTIIVKNGATMSVAGATILGVVANSSGTMQVQGTNSHLTTSGLLTIGGDGTGLLTIADGGAVTSSAGTIASTLASNSTVNVTGTGSTWTVTNDIVVGDQGLGHLNVLDGALVNAVNLDVSRQVSDAGIIVVDGLGSTLTATGTITVGSIGNGALTLSNGGVAATGALVIASPAGSQGHLIIGSDTGSAAADPGSLAAATVTFGAGTGDIIFHHTATNYMFASAISGNGQIKQAAGVTHLTTNSSGFSGATTVSGGALFVDGALGTAASTVAVNSGGRLGGSGTIGGATHFDSGATLVGVQGQTLTLASLALASGSHIDATLMNASATPLFNVTGNLVLDGVLDITATGAFGPGIYRLFNYGGTLTDNGLALGILPDGTSASDYAVQASAGHVDLIDSAAAQLRFWDGLGPVNDNIVRGGAGTWTTTSPNFTDAGGATNGPQTPQPSFVVFENLPGVVAIDDTAGQVAVTGMQFAIDGYQLLGDPIAVSGAQAIFRVGDGTAAGASYTGRIDSVLKGSGGINKTDLGTLELRGVNTYTGVTTISAGTLALAGSGTIASSSKLVDNGNFDIIFAPTSSVQSLTGSGLVTLGNSNLTLLHAVDTFDGALSGPGDFEVAGGTEVLTRSQNLWIGRAITDAGATLKLQGNADIALTEAIIDNGTLDISAITSAGTGVNGPLTGNGALILGSKTFTINDPSLGGSEFDGIISGTGGLTLAQGFTVLGGNNTYTGLTTIAAGTGLEVGNLTASGSIVGNIVNNGILSFGRSDNYTYAGAISGSGAVEIINTVNGTTTLTGTSTYTGDTYIAQGTLVGNATSLGSGVIHDGAHLIMNQTTNATFANDIDGNGGFIKRGNGTLTMTGADTATGATTVEAGTLNVNGTLTHSAIGVLSGGALGGTGTVGDVTVQNGGRLVGASGQTLIMNSLTLNASSIIDATLGAPSASALFAVTTNISLDGTLNITAAPSFGVGLYRLANYGGTVADNGLNIGTTPTGTSASDYTIQTGGGHIDLLSAAHPTGPTGPTSPTGPNGPFNFWDGGAPGNADNGKIDGGAGVWSVTAPTFTNADGTANRAMDPQPGFAIFEGAPGDVTIDGSAGTVGATGLQFASDGFTLSGNALDLGSSPAPIRVGDGTTDGAAYKAVIGSVLTGTGGMEKADLGTLILTADNLYTGGTTISDGALQIGNGGTSGGIVGDVTDNARLVFDRSDDVTFGGAIDGSGSLTKAGAGSLNYTGTGTLTGATTVMEGRLAVNGALAASAVTVQKGATLGGNGTVGSVSAESGATVAPGNSIGTLHVAGDYAQASGSIYAAELTSTGLSDLIQVGGSATIAPGATLNIIKTDAGAYKPGTKWTLLTATGGVTGTYNLTGDTQVSAFVGISAHYDANDVYLEYDQNQTFAGAGFTHNQIATGGGLDGVAGTNGAALALLMAPDTATARVALDQMSGEAHASIKAALIGDSRFVREAALGRIEAGGPGGVWGQAIASSGSIHATDNAAKVDRSAGGLLVGADMMAADVRVGVVGGYSHTSANLGRAGAPSNAKSSDLHLGVYAGFDYGELGLRGGAAISWHDVDSKRSVAFAGFSDKLTASYTARTAQIFGEAAYKLRFGKTLAEPFANLAWVDLRTGRIDEQGGAAALSGGRDTQGVAFSTTGLRASAPLDLQGQAVTVHGSFGWRRAWGDVMPSAKLAFAGGNAFSVEGSPIAKNAAAIDAGADTEVSQRIRLGVSYTGQLAHAAHENGVKATLAIAF